MDRVHLQILLTWTKSTYNQWEELYLEDPASPRTTNELMTRTEVVLRAEKKKRSTRKTGFGAEVQVKCFQFPSASSSRQRSAMQGENTGKYRHEEDGSTGNTEAGTREHLNPATPKTQPHLKSQPHREHQNLTGNIRT